MPGELGLVYMSHYHTQHTNAPTDTANGLCNCVPISHHPRPLSPPLSRPTSFSTSLLLSLLPPISHLVLNLIYQALELHKCLSFLLTETQLHCIGNVLEVLHLLPMTLPQYSPVGSSQAPESDTPSTGEHTHM